MTHNRPYNHYFIFALILISGLGLTLTLPWLANAHGLTAQSEVAALDNAPEVTRYYVAKTGDNSAPTEGWDTAYKNLQDAMIFAALSGGGEIWVAAGVYYPDEGGFQTNNDPSSTFFLVDIISLYGGFDTDDTLLSDRDWVKNVTVLSGDVDGNDFTNEDDVVIDTGNINGKNAFHVITTAGVITSAVVDGFTITAGQANSLIDPHHMGGGFYCDGSVSGNECNPSLTNITFSGNLATVGGAMYNDAFVNDSSPSLINVTFSGNSASKGGAMYNYSYSGSSSPSLTNVTFSGNSANDGGGAMFNYGYSSGTSSPILTNVIFSGNSAGGNGGAMYNDSYSSGASSPSLTNVTFSGNSADDDGGAMFNSGSTGGTSSPILTNVTFSGNKAGNRGGAMFNDGSTGGNSDPQVRNSIIWNNMDVSGTGTISATIHNNFARTYLVNSLSQGTGGSDNWTSNTSFVDGGGNIDQNPMFISPVYPATAPTTSGNLRLKSGSPANNSGKNIYIAVSTDLDGNNRIIDSIVDMGAYEGNYGFYQLTVTKAGAGDGQITSSPAGIDCGLDCSEIYSYGTEITLKTKSDTGSTFTGWSGDCSNTGDCSLTMTADKSISANFEPNLTVYLPIIFR